MKRNLLYSLILSICCMFVACDHEEGSDPCNKQPLHTLLLYMNADSNLDSSLENNVENAQAALKDSVQAGLLNLVIFYDHVRPTLYWVHKNEVNGLDTIPLKEYSSAVDACSKEVFKEVLDITFNQKFKDSQIKGLIFGGHALGWVPSDNYQPKPATRYIGYDSRPGFSGKVTSMEIWDFCDAIKECNLKLDYLFFDACNMGNIEVLYQLRGLTDYMVGATTEILGDGFPYSTVITRIGNCTNKSQLEDILDYCIDAYYSEYSIYTGAAISLFDLRKVEDLYLHFFTLLNHSPKLAELQAMMGEDQFYETLYWQREFQQFGRRNVDSEYLFYDFEQFVNYLDPENKYGASQVIDDADEVCPIMYYTEYFLNIQLKECSGITISFPQSLLNLCYSKSSRYISGYRETDWGAEMLRVLNY